ncbi:hypothetical protein HDU87_000638 [Geranomyces variabilis]|uniref:Uncharacterized protein n=1 Tax=Geranomyces variabilis TaxID=109894 RepID=A0AAD5TE99_9FUNG|nr:hypothetical protein HDU87_000638 [Geranomyces variabilis]
MQRFFYYDGELHYPGGRQGMWTWQADLATASVCRVAVRVSDNRLTRKKQRALLHYCDANGPSSDPDGMILQSFNSSTPSAPDYQTASRPASGAPKTFLSHKYCSIGRTLQCSIPGSLLTSPGSLPLLPDREKISIVAGTTAITVMDPTAAPQTSNGIFQKGTIERLTGHAFSSVSAPGVPTLVPDLTIANGSFVLNESIEQGLVTVQLPFFCGDFGAKGLEARDLSPWPSLEDIFADMRSRARSLYAQVPSAVPLYDGDRPDGTLYTRAKGQPRFPGAFSVQYEDLYGRMFYICILSVHWKASANAAQVQWDLEILLAVKEFLNIEFGCAQSTIVLGISIRTSSLSFADLDHFAVDRNLVGADAVLEYLDQYSGAAVASMQELGAAWNPNWGPAQDATWKVPTNDAPIYFGKQLFSRLYNPSSMDDDSPTLWFDQIQCEAVRYAHPGNNPASTAKSLVYCLYQVKQGSTTQGFNMVASIHDYAGSSGQTPAPLSSGNMPVPTNIGARLEDFCNSHLATVDVATRGTWACDFSGSHVGPFAPYQTRVRLVILDLLYYCGTNWELPENCNNPLSGFQLANQVCAVPQPLSTPQNPLPPVPISRITRPDYVVRDSKIDEYLEGLENEAICTAATDSQECAGTDLPCRMIAISDHLPVHANLSGNANF